MVLHRPIECTSIAGAFFFDPSGGILYVEDANGAGGSNPNLRVYDTSTVVELPSSPLPFSNTNFACGRMDPYGPFAYCQHANSPAAGISAFQIDPITGIMSQPGPLSAPFYPQLSITPTVLTGTASQLNSSVPSLGWSPTSVTFGSTKTGQSSAPQVVTIKNIGNLLASFNSITITGPNASDFSKSNDVCTANVILQPTRTCTLSITYSPADAGTSQATLVITDDAVGSPQKIGLSGTAVAPPPPVPVVSLSPSGTLNFPGTATEGTSSAPQNITVTNTGNGPLHVASIAVGGFNSNDFVVNTSNCLGAAVAAGTNCTIPITFAPLAAGIRTTTLTIKDDAATSPEMVTLNATATPAVTIVAPTGVTTQSVAAGQPTNYSLALTPGDGFNGTVSLTCSGAPVGATCSVPASVQVVSTANTLFSVAVTTSGAAHALLPYSSGPRFGSFKPWAVLYALTLLLIAALARSTRTGQIHAKWSAWSSTFAAIVLFAVFGVAGCGGGASAGPPPPPPVITPAGTYTLTVTPSAMSASGKPLELQPMQLTLKVGP